MRAAESASLPTERDADDSEQQAASTLRMRAIALRKSTDFDQVFAHGARLTSSTLSLHYRPNEIVHARLGLGVARRVSRKATRRNRIKRVLRETFRALADTLPAFDIVVVVRPAAATLSNAALREALNAALARVQQRAHPTFGNH